MEERKKDTQERCAYCKWCRRMVYEQENIEELGGKLYYPIRYFCSLNPPQLVVRGRKIWSCLPQVDFDGICRYFRYRSHSETIEHSLGMWCEDSQRLASKESLDMEEDFLDTDDQDWERRERERKKCLALIREPRKEKQNE